MDLFEDDGAPAGDGNAPEYSVSELSGAVKRVVEGEFGYVRVRGEIGRVTRHRSGHIYLDLKDERACLAGVIWRGAAAKIETQPEEGMEVIARGRLTTFPGQSKYQMVIEDLAPAGLGALMAMLEKRRAALAAEGLFDPARRRPLPFLPEVIGVVTSPTGAVIRDILHRLRDRFPRRVLVWPVAVQGPMCAPEVVRAIEGFNALAPGGPVPRPDLLIVARGGGSVEDLWGFNEEAVVRAAAASAIPLISAVGHETDTTLIDHAADRRAPTPTAAAEMAVPVRLDLLARVSDAEARTMRCARHAVEARRQRLRDLARGLPRPETLLDGARQRQDAAADRLGRALQAGTAARGAALREAAAVLRPPLLLARLERSRRDLREARTALPRALRAETALARGRLERTAAGLRPAGLALRVRGERQVAGKLDTRAASAVRARQRRGAEALAGVVGRLRPEAVARAAAQAGAALAPLAGRLDAAGAALVAARAERVEGAVRLLGTLGYRETLRRGFAVVRAGGAVVTSAAAAAEAAALEVEFADGRLAASPQGAALPPPEVPQARAPRRPRKPNPAAPAVAEQHGPADGAPQPPDAEEPGEAPRKRRPRPSQGSLFD